ncbi:IS4 family transposase, partial [Nitrosomonas sp.]|uniref:IS4 family transposase n=1 Tax=Nitrosomonas sp. TaxID=42353 RepID=UPI0025D01A9E
YIDYAWFNQLTNKGVYFVTRLKSNASYKVVERHPVQKNKGLVSDQTIMLTGHDAVKRCPIPLRRIVYRDQETGKQYTFLTNHFKLAARTIADIYKARWQVELFFKWIKQNLKIKSFVGTSKNAVMTQIWIALCVYLLIAFIKFQSTIQISMQQILRFFTSTYLKNVISWHCYQAIHLLIGANMITSQPYFERKVSGTAVILESKLK